MRVLVVEDERDLASAIHDGLGRQGFAVDLAYDVAEGTRLAEAYPYAALVLDRALPDGDGLALCRQLRRAGYAGGILVLTARDALDDRVAGLDAGADDYLVKPFAFKELIARLRAVARRHTPNRSSRLTARDLLVNLDEGTVKRGDELLALGRKEYMLLVHLMRHAGRLLTREQLVEAAWDAEADASPEAVRAHVKNLRKKVCLLYTSPSPRDS